MKLGVYSGLAAAVAGLFAVCSAADAQQFALRLPGLYDSEFPHGGSLRISRQPVTEMQFLIGSPAADRIADGAVSVQVNGLPLEPKTIHEAGRLVVTVVKADEERDLFPADSPARVVIKVRRTSEYGQTWIVDRHELPFAIETAGDDEGVPVEIHLAAPSPPILIPRKESRTMVFKGTVNRKDAKVTINGDKAPLKARPDGSGDFSLSARIAPDQKDIVVEAEGSKSDSCRLVIPVRRL